MEAARLVVFAATCSIEAAISLTPDTSSSVAVATASDCVPVWRSDAVIPSMPAHAPRRAT